MNHSEENKISTPQFHGIPGFKRKLISTKKSLREFVVLLGNKSVYWKVELDPQIKISIQTPRKCLLSETQHGDSLPFHTKQFFFFLAETLSTHLVQIE